MPTDATGFTTTDRETLTTVKVQLGFLVVNVQDAMARISKLEETRLTSRDLQDLMSDTDTLRAEKKELEKRVEERLAALEKKMDERVTPLERWRWQIVGGAIAAGSIAGLILRLIGK